MTVYAVRKNAAVLALTLLAGCEAAPPPPAGMPALELVRERLAGDVVEALAAGTYTYARLRLDGGDERWVVVAGREHRGAPRLALDCHGRRRDFVSPRLGRSFALLHFCSPVQPPTP